MIAAAEEIRQALHSTLGPCIDCGGDADDECAEGAICNVCAEERETHEAECDWCGNLTDEGHRFCSYGCARAAESDHA